jgi:hypothetical protein
MPDIPDQVISCAFPYPICVVRAACFSKHVSYKALQPGCFDELMLMLADC